MPRGKHASNLCLDCQNACGGCEWTEVDPKTGKIRFAPVPGWTAEPVSIRYPKGMSKQERLDTGYHITACPKFSRIPERKKQEAYKGAAYEKI